MRKPLFYSVESEPVPPELRWRIAEPAQILGKQLVLAGKPISLYTHRVGRRTWPCLKSLPMLGMECPHCERARAKKCWCPVIHFECNVANPDLLILMGANTLSDSLNMVKKGDLIEAKKCRALKPTWTVHRNNDQAGAPIAWGLCAKYVPENGDITRWLLHYWQWSEITKAFGERARESIKTKMLREDTERLRLSLTDETQAG